LTRHDSVRHALLDAATFSSAKGCMMNKSPNRASQRIMSCSDDPQHLKMICLFAKPLSPKVIRAQAAIDRRCSWNARDRDPRELSRPRLDGRKYLYDRSKPSCRQRPPRGRRALRAEPLGLCRCTRSDTMADPCERGRSETAAARPVVASGSLPGPRTHSRRGTTASHCAAPAARPRGLRLHREKQPLGCDE
jgi:hypothetical protein